MRLFGLQNRQHAHRPIKITCRRTAESVPRTRSNRCLSQIDQATQQSRGFLGVLRLNQIANRIKADVHQSIIFAVNHQQFALHRVGQVQRFANFLQGLAQRDAAAGIVDRFACFDPHIVQRVNIQVDVDLVLLGQKRGQISDRSLFQVQHGLSLQSRRDGRAGRRADTNRSVIVRGLADSSEPFQEITHPPPRVRAGVDDQAIAKQLNCRSPAEFLPLRRIHDLRNRHRQLVPRIRVRPDPFDAVKDVFRRINDRRQLRIVFGFLHRRPPQAARTNRPGHFQRRQ